MEFFISTLMYSAGGATLFDYSFCCINLVYLVIICMILSPEHRIDHLSCYDIGFNQDLSLNIVMTDLQDMDSTRIRHRSLLSTDTQELSLSRTISKN